MPVMAYLAVEDPRSLSRDDFVRLGLVTAPGIDQPLPYSGRHVADFEERYCYDRFWDDRPGGPSTRYLCCGHALVVVGERAIGAVHQPGAGRPLAVPPPALPAVPDRALPEGRAADVLGSARAGAQEARHQRSGVGEALQARDPAELRDLPPLHAPLLVPRGVRPGAGQGAVPAVRAASRPRPAVRRGEGAHLRHERIPRQRQPAPPGEHRRCA